MTINCPKCSAVIAQWDAAGMIVVRPNIEGEYVVCACRHKVTLQKFNDMKGNEIIKDWQANPPKNFFIHVRPRDMGRR